jgi:hypothetical protein
MDRYRSSERKERDIPRDVCAEVAVDLDAALLVQLHANLLDAQIVEVRSAAHADQHHI